VSPETFFISLQWKNIGAAPTYENWDAFYELKIASIRFGQKITV
jgi:hypothetical protein